MTRKIKMATRKIGRPTKINTEGTGTIMTTILIEVKSDGRERRTTEGSTKNHQRITNAMTITIRIGMMEIGVNLAKSHEKVTATAAKNGGSGEIEVERGTGTGIGVESGNMTVTAAKTDEEAAIEAPTASETGCVRKIHGNIIFKHAFQGIQN
jgi:hypothetical protein